MDVQKVIHSNPEILGGTPVFLGTRVPVQTLQGIPGYGLPGNGAYGGTPVYIYYSQDYGYWYTANPYDAPPASSYRYHGIPFNLFTEAGTQQFCMSTCNAGQEQSCNNLQGIWDPVSCTCGAPPDPCAPFYENICNQVGGVWNYYGTCTCNDQCEVYPWTCPQPCDPRFEICPEQPCGGFGGPICPEQ